MTRLRGHAIVALLFVGSLVLLLSIAELLFRVAIARGIGVARDPLIYADGFSDDNFWKLQYRWHPNNYRLPRNWVHPLLGWAPPVTPANPLGTVDNHPDLTKKEGHPVLFYGDSFVQGVVGAEASIPAHLERFLPNSAVVNYGVGGYGLDQIFLRMRLTARRFESPIIVIGVLTIDLDRSLLKVRAGPKPHFVLLGERPSLRGVPIANATKWFDEHPPTIRSYACTWLVRRLKLATWGEEGLPSWRRHETTRLNAHLLEKIVRGTRAQGLPLLFVVFYTRKELRFVQWRERFLRNRFAALRISYVDTKPLLDPWRDYLLVGDLNSRGHLNSRGNERVAAAIADTLVRREVGFGTTAR